ncbi:MAG: hypothetical protein NTZ75_07640 [Euryarchaeota archaeon]|nr:hypothetical protein [Euryarchaeota archaeon]
MSIISELFGMTGSFALGTIAYLVYIGIAFFRFSTGAKEVTIATR